MGRLSGVRKLMNLELGSILRPIFTDASNALASRHPWDGKFEADVRRVQGI